MQVFDRHIGPGEPPFIIAEMSNNHLQDFSRAKAIVDAAKEAGADAIKIQTYRPESITLDSKRPEFKISTDPWKGRYYYDLYKEICMPWDWNEKLFDYAQSLGLAIFSSPFDREAVDLLENLGCPVYKIASFELTYDDLIEAVANTGKPIIMSTGVANQADISRALAVAQRAGAQQIALLHCVSAYPSSYADMNLRSMAELARFTDYYGLSDHSLSSLASLASIALGGCIIEKHLTLSREDGGPDAGFSLEPEEFTRLCVETRQLWQSLGREDLYQRAARTGAVHGRSLFFAHNLSAGEKIEAQDVRVIRPNHGLPPSCLADVLGKKLKAPVEQGQPLSWDLFDH